MANFGGTFDASQIDPNKPMETLPPGDYRVQIVNSEMRITKEGSGQYLWIEMDILDGKYSGMKTFDRLNLINTNQKAVEIAQRTLSAICHAIGKLQVSDSEELHFKPLIVSLKVDEKGYNQVKGYKPVNNQTPMPAVNRSTPPRQSFQPQQTAAVPPPPSSPPAQQMSFAPSGDGPWKRM
jgi:hypothetical protein